MGWMTSTMTTSSREHHYWVFILILNRNCRKHLVLFDHCMQAFITKWYAWRRESKEMFKIFISIDCAKRLTSMHCSFGAKSWTTCPHYQGTDTSQTVMFSSKQEYPLGKVHSIIVLFEAFCHKFLLFLESQLEFLIPSFSLLGCVCWDSLYFNGGQHLVGNHLLYLLKLLSKLWK